MKDNYKSLLITFVVVVLGICLLLFLNITPEGENNLVPCYDKFGNEIIGEECLENEYDDIRVMFAFMGVILSSFGIFGFLVSIGLIIGEKFAKFSEVKK